MDRPDPPFTYRIEHRADGASVVLERIGSYDAAEELVAAWADRLRERGAAGAILVVEEAFGTTVAHHPILRPGAIPADGRHGGGIDAD